MPGQVMVIPGKIFEPKVLMVHSESATDGVRPAAVVEASQALANCAGVKGWVIVE